MTRMMSPPGNAEPAAPSLRTRAIVAFLTLPGVFALALPIALARVDPWRAGVQVEAMALLTLGVVVLLWCVRDFYVSGKGTLAPWAPPKRLVVVGLYRYTRNPMYIGVLLTVSGIAWLAASFVVACYCAALAAGFHLRVVMNEEPWLAGSFGGAWDDYVLAVPRWLPRLRPWHPEDRT